VVEAAVVAGLHAWAAWRAPRRSRSRGPLSAFRKEAFRLAAERSISTKAARVYDYVDTAAVNELFRS
jgi:hypothetical protein